MQDGLVFFSQKTTRVGFDRCFLSFLMEFAGQRYDFNRTLKSRAESPGGGYGGGNFLLPCGGVVWYNRNTDFRK